jgi:mono/diheme cytochrome c family protein
MKPQNFLKIVVVNVSLAGLMVACEKPVFEEGKILAGEEISARALNRGRELYMQNCYACHGTQGDGRGPASAFLRPPPRDFRTGVFKFGLAMNGLPHTDDLVKMVRRGLDGTAMLPWDMPEGQVVDVINYIKTFSDKWSCEAHESCGANKCARVAEDGSVSCYREQKLGERIEAPRDPWIGREEEAIETGLATYHVQAQCRKCHPAYVTEEKLWDITRGGNEWAFSKLTYRPALKTSKAFKGVTILPIDFLYHPIKNLRSDDTPVQQRALLFRLIGSGINGAAMPAWKGSLSDEQIWSLAYYIQDLYSKRGSAQAFELRHLLDNQKAFVPPSSETQDEAKQESL